MKSTRFTGPSAGSHKYDLLTALAVAGLSGTPGFQTSMLRLVALVTARYNWARDELTVGQREMARLWSVDERTVKREIKRLTSAEILLQLRPGVRGRVAAYRLNLPEIHRLSAPVWDRVGPDYSERMTRQQPASEPPKVVHVAFGQATAEAGQGGQPAAQIPPGQATSWDRMMARLTKLEPNLHRNWFAALTCSGCEGGVLRVKAPSAFVAQYIQTHHLRVLMGAAELEFPGLRRIEFES
ncbi:DnaA N-terminal domain-containing protein [Marinibacterium profundimaris]|uniref:DnaA N-terminal domain-containing protein n=1 Tax=Marinibacterium profundimaris TaxID=1679460 RepID=A0A225NEJ4_9RHOB|nr:DnaA N-terminal domain-containing protein [Marinibacterium profundimaris]OWU71007.1 hypothetical protein ATO3_19420 [Marinibacterium profundimaris]